MDDATGKFEPKTQARTYQLEMFQESMRRNIVVTMNTGSGKTQVAIMRIAAELERSQPGKIVWMICPTVVLALQQCQVLETQLPAIQCRSLTSADNVDLWKYAKTWQAALKNIQVVVSTPQVLYDAMLHGFVPITLLSLIVYDEAHHCIKNHPTNKIMQEFYHPHTSSSRDDLPYILGLTASPASSQKALIKMEQNLDAICRAPRIHIQDLQQHVHQPQLLMLEYEKNITSSPPALRALGTIIFGFDILTDPYIIYLHTDRRPQSQEKLAKALEERSSPSLENLKKLRAAAEDVQKQLGNWAVTHYLRVSIQKLLSIAMQPATPVSPMSNQQIVFLSQLLAPILQIPELPLEPKNISPKVRELIQYLLDEYNEEVNGIIFVERRSTAVVLSALLSTDRQLVRMYQLSPVVGSATHSSKGTDLADIADTKFQQETLESFRGGTKNMLVATSVLEEGLDVSATNLVIRFDLPKNLRSYIQSRGRARRAESKFVMMLQADDPDADPLIWDGLERSMEQAYQQDRILVEEKVKTEAIEEESDKFLSVDSTGARLALTEVPRHLQHFCALLSKDPYVENRPHFILEEVGKDRKIAKVVLPSAIDASLRESSSRDSWKTERMAKADSAFEAYSKLRAAGLINDHLLPFRAEPNEVIDIQRRDGKAKVQPRYDVWADAASRWDHHPPCAMDIRIRCSQREFSTLKMFLPIGLRSTLKLKLHLASSIAIEATITPDAQISSLTPAKLEAFSYLTTFMLQSLYPLGLPNQDPQNFAHLYPYLLIMKEHIERYEAGDTLFHLQPQPQRPLLAEDGTPTLDESTLRTGLIRRNKRGPHSPPYIFKSFLRQQPDEVDSDRGDSAGDSASATAADAPNQNQVIHCALRQFPRGRNFLKASEPDNASTTVDTVPAKDCRFDPFPYNFAEVMLFFPSIAHGIELRLVAERLNESILKQIGISDITLIETAISAPSAREPTNYERLEFLGDAILKYFTSIQLYAEHKLWHEGRLTVEKTTLINNSHLYKVAIALGLDRFIHTEQFQATKWQAPQNADLLEKDEPQQRVLSTKLLADVVEALIGAAYMDGTNSTSREKKTLAALGLFLPEVNWLPLPKIVSMMIPPEIKSWNRKPVHLNQLQELLGYQFKFPALLVTALTHPSFPPLADETCSYQRLEFIGDALLDWIIVETMFLHRKSLQLSQSRMTLIRNAVVNAEILGFFALHSSCSLKTENPRVNERTGEITIESKINRRNLCDFMRDERSPSILAARKSTNERYKALQSSISEAILHGSTYPWLDLARLRPEKFHSDIIESILAAIFIDSGGDLKACRTWLKKLGLLDYLDRILDQEVDYTHPRLKIEQLTGGQRVQYKNKRKDVGKPSDFLNQVDASGINITQDFEDLSLTPSFASPSTMSSSSSGSNLTGISSPGLSSPPPLSSSSSSSSSSPLSSSPVNRAFSCTIYIDGEAYGEAKNGGSRPEVEIQAALQAIVRLEQEQSSITAQQKKSNKN